MRAPSRSSSAGSSSRTLRPADRPEVVLARYREPRGSPALAASGAPWPDGSGRDPPSTAAARPRPTIGDWDAQLDLAWIVGLLLRGWRKGLDAEAGASLGSGVAAGDDLAWWSERAVEAAGRRLWRYPTLRRHSAEEASHAQDRPEPARHPARHLPVLARSSRPTASSSSPARSATRRAATAPSRAASRPRPARCSTTSAGCSSRRPRLRRRRQGHGLPPRLRRFRGDERGLPRVLPDRAADPGDGRRDRPGRGLSVEIEVIATR